MAGCCAARVLVVSLFLTVPIFTAPLGVEGQSEPALQARVERLVDQMGVASSFASLSDDFVAHFLILAPSLPAEDRELLHETAERVFSADSITRRVARALAADIAPEDVAQLAETAAAGPIATLGRQYPDPSPSSRSPVADVASLDSERLQLMVGLVEARRSSDLALTLDEALRHAAHRLLVRLGGTSEAFVPLSDDQLDAAYRNRTIQLAVEAMQRLEAADDTLVTAAVEAYRTEPARSFSERSIEAVVAAIGDAEEELTRELGVATPAEPAPAEPVDPGSAPPCQILPCGFVVRWDGPEPSGDNLAYGRPGDLEDYTYQILTQGGYRLIRGSVSDGFTIHLRARSQPARCEVVVGLNPRSCLAVGRVEVDFAGTYPGFEGEPFTVRNRCRATAVLAARGIASLVAARIHHELTTYPGDERKEPRC